MQAIHDKASAPGSTRSRYQICTPRVAHQTIDGETVIIDFETGAYFSTTRLGAEVWDHLAAGRSVAEIVQAVAARYSGDRHAIEAGLLDFLRLLERETLIAPAPDHGTADLAPAVAASTERAAFEAPTLQKYTDMADLLLLDPIHDVDESGWPMKKA